MSILQEVRDDTSLLDLVRSLRTFLEAEKGVPIFVLWGTREAILSDERPRARPTAGPRPNDSVFRPTAPRGHHLSLTSPGYSIEVEIRDPGVLQNLIATIVSGFKTEGKEAGL